MADELVAAGETASRPKIFISYSREDIAFVDRLAAALNALGFDPLVDRTEILAFEDWWNRIESLIAKSDTVIFVLSPDAVESKNCAKEVAFAASLNKRFAPIVFRRVSNGIPEPLARLNFFFFDGDSDFNNSMKRLGEALTTDIEWVRRHTEVVEKAWRWAAAGRPGRGELLLRSRTLEEAEQWIASRPHEAPQPTEATQPFIAASRRAATRWRNIVSAGLGAGLIVALGLTVVALWQRGKAQAALTVASANDSQSLAALSRVAVDDDEPNDALQLALASWPRNVGDQRPRLEAALQSASRAVATGRLYIRQWRHDGPVNGALLTKDERRILSWGGE
jgi:hypothetical protein